MGLGVGVGLGLGSGLGFGLGFGCAATVARHSYWSDLAWVVWIRWSSGSTWLGLGLGLGLVLT